MEEGEGSGAGGRMGRGVGVGEVDYKTKAGTAWSHNFLNQKPWHPLSYPNQRRKWIAEQTNANKQSRQEEINRELAQERENLRQMALLSKKDKEKMEIAKAVSFMYVRPPGYNAESATAAEIADQKKRTDQIDGTQDPAASSTSTMAGKGPEKNQTGVDKKARPKDVFGRSLPTEEEFEVLKNAPRLDTGLPVRIKPFAVEIRNVRCVRCGTYGHQSGDRECPLKDVVMPNEESRLKRDDPLTAIKAQIDSAEPLKWELKQKPGISPPRGGYGPDDPNQQIVADDIFDEYGGFLTGGDIPTLLSNFSTGRSKLSKSKARHKRQSSSPCRASKGHNSSPRGASSSDSEAEKSKRRTRSKRRKNYFSESSNSDSAVEDRKHKRKSRQKHHKEHKSKSSSSDEEDHERAKRHTKRKHREKRGHPEMLDSSDFQAGSDKERRQHSRRPRKKHHHRDSSPDNTDWGNNSHHQRRK